MVKAVRFCETGGAEVLKVEDIEVGDPCPGEARVRHNFIALNFIDTCYRTATAPRRVR
jgi:NADPH2:quinone reductase